MLQLITWTRSKRIYATSDRTRIRHGQSVPGARWVKTPSDVGDLTLPAGRYFLMR